MRAAGARHGSAIMALVLATAPKTSASHTALTISTSTVLGT